MGTCLGRVKRRGRQVRLENGRSRITANSVADAEKLLAALTKHEKQLGLLHVTKARQPATEKKAAAKRKKEITKTEIISPSPELQRGVVYAQAEGGAARARSLHRADQ
jgi:hypothetical protein